jgi:hypothetical protein
MKTKVVEIEGKKVTVWKMNFGLWFESIADGIQLPLRFSSHLNDKSVFGADGYTLTVGNNCQGLGDIRSYKNEAVVVMARVIRRYE